MYASVNDSFVPNFLWIFRKREKLSALSQPREIPNLRLDNFLGSLYDLWHAASNMFIPNEIVVRPCAFFNAVKPHESQSKTWDQLWRYRVAAEHQDAGHIGNEPPIS